MNQNLLTSFTAVLVLIVINNACPDECECDSYNLHVECWYRKVKGFPRNIPFNTEKITFIQGNIGLISPYDFADFTELKELKLISSSITNLHRDAFKRLTKLERLDLSNNKLTRIVNGTFSSLTSLKILNLYTNSISVIESSAFAGLKSLVKLALNGNQLDNVDKIFDINMPQLTDLSLNANKITTVGKNSFDRLVNLTYLDLSSNQLIDIQSESFLGLGNLRELRLFSNKIKYYRAKVFHPLTKLTLLWFSYNRLFSLNKDSLSGLICLKKLTLGANNLRNLPKDIFSDLSNLEEIELSNNMIGSFKEGTFSQLTNLKELRLENNNIVSIHKHMFAGLFLLKRLYLKNNGLAYIQDGAFDSLVKVDSLDLKDNRLTELQSNILNKMTKLTDLDISNNRIIKVGEESFSGLKLRSLDMFGNMVNCSCSYIRLLRNVVRDGNAISNCILYPGNRTLVQKIDEMRMTNGKPDAVWNASKWRVCNGHCDDNFYIKIAPCVLCDNKVPGYCSKVVVPGCLLLWYNKKVPFSFQMPGIQMEMEKLNEKNQGECPLDQCPFPTQIMKLIVNKSVSCHGDGKDEQKEETKNIFSNPFLLISVVATPVILPLIFIIIAYYCWRRGSGAATNSTRVMISIERVNGKDGDGDGEGGNGDGDQKRYIDGEKEGDTDVNTKEEDK